MDAILVTLDVDWAPDFVIDDVAQSLIETGTRATWFVTHASPAIERLRARPDLFELGIHPNFLPGSTHGEDPDAVLDHITAVVPEAVSMRTHAVVQSGPLLAEVVRRTNIQVDSSIFLPEMPHIRPVAHLTPYGVLTRVPFFWADDYEMLKPVPRWDARSILETPGVRAVMFHPLHVALNSASRETYEGARSACRALADLEPREVQSRRATGPGAGSLFAELVERLGGDPPCPLMRELSPAPLA